MPHRIIDSQIADLQKRMEELEQESAKLEAQLEELQNARKALGVNDTTKILTGADVPEAETPN